MHALKATLPALLLSVALAGAQTAPAPADNIIITPPHIMRPAEAPPAPVQPAPAHSSLSITSQTVAVPSDAKAKCKHGSDDTTFTPKVVLGQDAHGDCKLKVYAIVD